MKQLVKNKLADASIKLGFRTLANFSVEEPPQNASGDWATNIALICFSEVANMANMRTNNVAINQYKSPRELAEKIKVELEKDGDIESVQIAGPGFINITLKNELYLKELNQILVEKENYGKSNIGSGKKVNVEYISANPTGPLHIGNARSGPIGEAAAGLYEFMGFDVTREYYVNDVGNQIRKFGKSLLYWYEKEKNPVLELPEGLYPGEYIKELSEKVIEENGPEIEKLSGDKLVDLFAREGIRLMVANIKADAALIDINFDKWTFESEISESEKPKKVIDDLEQKGLTVKKDGALWFKRPDDPDLADQESVLQKSDTSKTITYFTNDIAYHIDKFERVGDGGLLIDVWGANHSGHIPRIKSALSALGFPADRLEIMLYQYVRLKKAGEAMSMGKRLGNFVTLRQVIEAGVAPDAFKYFILSQNPNTPFDFDIELAADTSEKNPVFYIKYAHARICSILEKAREQGININDQADLKSLRELKEQALYKELVKFPELLDEIMTSFQIQALPHFAYNLAGLFHDFYNDCRVITEDKELTLARLSLISATKYVLANSLNILGIEAPEKM